MALITDLPTATSIADTDYIVKDTGTTTQKIAMSNMPSRKKITGTFTASSDISGATVYEETEVVQVGRVVMVHVSITGLPTGADLSLGTISGVSLPVKNIRTVGAVGAALYQTSNPVYAIISTSGSVNIYRGSSTGSAVNVFCTYLV